MDACVGGAYYLVQTGDYCQEIVDEFNGKFTLSQFYSWNPAVGVSRFPPPMMCKRDAALTMMGFLVYSLAVVISGLGTTYVLVFSSEVV